jgi:aryl-alcohol dehydrogenase-like predicted oxidoreductase
VSSCNQAGEAGVTYFDTADSYSRGRSEQLFGKALIEFFRHHVGA